MNGRSRLSRLGLLLFAVVLGAVVGLVLGGVAGAIVGAALALLIALVLAYRRWLWRPPVPVRRNDASVRRSTNTVRNGKSG
jgi:O-antigen/teichoic acid export membrane protein